MLKPIAAAKDFIASANQPLREAARAVHAQGAAAAA